MHFKDAFVKSTVYEILKVAEEEAEKNKARKSTTIYGIFTEIGIALGPHIGHAATEEKLEEKRKEAVAAGRKSDDT